MSDPTEQPVTPSEPPVVNTAATPPAAAAPQGYAAPPQAYPAAPQGYATPPQAYPAAPQAYAAPPQGYPAPQGSAPADGRPKTLAIVALALAAVGIAMAFIPFVTWVSGAVLLAAFIVAIVALVSKKQGGKGLSIAALAMSVVGWVISIVVAIASVSLIANAARDAIGEDVATITSPSPVDEEAAPSQAPIDARQDLVVVDSTFGRTSYDPTIWWYVVVLENPNTDYIFDFASFDVEAIDASGTILDTASDYRTVLSGRTVLAGTFFSIGQGEITSLNLRGPAASEAISAPADETGSFVIDGLAATTDSYSTSVTGTVSGTFESEQELVEIVVVARTPEGSILGAESTYVDRLPTDGGKVQFETTFLDVLPEGTTFEAFASL